MALMASTVRRWMKDHASEYADECNEVRTTALAESAADAFGENHIGGCLDDSTHPIWDWAVEVADWYEKAK